jgi:hypothetical protein
MFSVPDREGLALGGGWRTAAFAVGMGAECLPPCAMFLYKKGGKELQTRAATELQANTG